MGNLQGTFNAFDLKMGRVKKNRNFTRVPMPDSVVKLVNDWGKRSQKEHQKNKLELFNRLQKQIDWDNSEYDDNKGLVSDTSDTHPDIPEELPGIDMASGEDNDVVVFPETDHQVVADDEANAVIGSAPVKTPGVDTVVDELQLINVINDYDDNDDDDDDDDGSKECSEKDDIKMIVNVVADDEYHIPVSGMPVSKSNLRRGTRTRNPTIHYEANFENKNYSDSNVPVSGTVHVNVHDDEAPIRSYV